MPLGAVSVGEVRQLWRAGKGKVISVKVRNGQHTEVKMRPHQVRMEGGRKEVGWMGPDGTIITTGTMTGTMTGTPGTTAPAVADGLNKWRRRRLSVNSISLSLSSLSSLESLTSLRPLLHPRHTHHWHRSWFRGKLRRNPPSPCRPGA